MSRIKWTESSNVVLSDTSNAIFFPLGIFFEISASDVRDALLFISFAEPDWQDYVTSKTLIAESNPHLHISNFKK